MSRAALIDTHCHLDAAAFDADRALIVAEAAAAGVTRLVVPAVERANFAAVASLCREYPDCVPAYGIHPLYVEQARQEDLAVLDSWLGKADCVAVGEIGLDGYVPQGDTMLQERYFVAQLELARHHNLPVILHVRRAVDLVLKQLRRIRVPGGIAHAFNGSRQQADAFIDLGFKLGFGGAMTYAGSKRIRALATSLPLTALVLETDAPDIPPAWKVGTRNTPADLHRIAVCLAELRKMDITDVAAATVANARAVLPRLQAFNHQGETT